MIAYIPARGGSKRVPRKNIKKLGGKPIVAHVIETAKSLDFIRKVCVSTDDTEIQDIVIKYGAETGALRASKLADDYVDCVTLIKEDVPRFVNDSEDFLMILPTAALVQVNHYYSAYALFKERTPHVLMSTVEYPISPFWAMVLDENGFCKPVHPESLKIRSQDLPRTCVDAGLFYMMSKNRIHNKEGPGHENVLAYNIPSDIAVDVDNPVDWEELEILFQKQKESKKLL